jgi:hypothetical protein
MAHPVHRPPRHKVLAAVAAPFASAAVVAAVVGAFHHVSSVPWVAPHGEAAALVAGCDREPSRRARAACVRDVVARVQQREKAQAVAVVAP